mgnify:CR=1 FL=1
MRNSDLYLEKVQKFSPDWLFHLGAHTDLEYWGIDKLLLDACCAIRHYPEMEIRRREYEASKKNFEREERRRIGADFGDSSFARYRAMVWNSMEYPESSIPARVGNRYYKRSILSRKQVYTCDYCIYRSTATNVLIALTIVRNGIYL